MSTYPIPQNAFTHEPQYTVQQISFEQHALGGL